MKMVTGEGGSGKCGTKYEVRSEQLRLAAQVYCHLSGKVTAEATSWRTLGSKERPCTNLPTGLLRNKRGSALGTEVSAISVFFDQSKPVKQPGCSPEWNRAHESAQIDCLTGTNTVR